MRTSRNPNRIIRRRLNARKEIALEEPPQSRGAQTVHDHARTIVGGIVALIALGALLLSLPWVTRSGDATPVPDAIFTATSAISVTGLVVVDTHDHWNIFGQVIILVLIQFGGLGIMVGTSIALRILMRKVSIGLRESLLIQSYTPTLSLQEASDLTKRVVRFTFAVEMTGAILLAGFFLTRGDPLHIALWRGLFTAVSAFCNAGFDVQGHFQSLTAYKDSVPFNLAVIGLIQTGALSYIVISDVVSMRRWRKLAVNSKVILIANGVLLLTGFIVFVSAEWNGALASSPPLDRPIEALFQTVSARTAGFSTVDFSHVSSFTDLIWIAIMGIGGASGSAAGGVKLGTVAVLVVAMVEMFRGGREPELFRRELPVGLVLQALALVVLFFATHFMIASCLALSEHLAGNDPAFISVLFESMSALATVGLSNGITTSLSTAGKLIVVAAMLVGRLSPLTIVYALQTHQREKRYRLPRTHLHIG